MKQFLVNKNINIIEALKKITSNRSKHLLVVDQKERVIGILSDGDIRRAILKKIKLQSRIVSIFNKNFFYFKEKKFSKDKAINIMIEKNLSFAPVLNEVKKIVDIITLNQQDLKNTKLKSFEKSKKIPVVIMAGGLGTRMKPFTNILPKPLIPVGNKTVIENIIDKFMHYQIKNFIVTLNYKSQIIKSFFNEIKLEKKINFYVEKKPLGTIGALSNLKKKLKGNFFLTNSDSIIDIDINDFIEFHETGKNDFTIAAAIKKYQVPYGSCDIDKKGNLKSIIEKPRYDLLVNTGFYLVNSKILRFIKKNKKMDVDEFINVLLQKKRKIKIYPISEMNWQDVGQWDEYNKLSLK